MPVPNVEQLKEKEASLKKLIADQGESTERAKRRALGKKLRRVQRRRRKLAVEAERRAVKPKAAPEAAALEAAAPKAAAPEAAAPEAAAPEAAAAETKAAETPEAKEE